MICAGPMSPEIIETVFKYSELYNISLSLIASKNQIDYDGGYVNNWTTSQYMEYIGSMKIKYPKSIIKICRDHCGVGFNGNYSLDNVYNTIRCDIEHGFDLIHIDFCHLPGTKKDIIKESIYAIEYAKKLNPNIEFEIGTDEISEKPNLKRLLENIKIFLDYCHPKYYVVNTGSLVKDMTQVGQFDLKFVSEANKAIRGHNVLLKEHNADYLFDDEIKLRKGLINAVNIAPQLGVEQTKKIVSLASLYGINSNDFLNACYDSGKWSKWIYNTNPNDNISLSIMAGHYNYCSNEYLNLYEQLYKLVDIKFEIEQEIFRILKNYEKAF